MPLRAARAASLADVIRAVAFCPHPPLLVPEVAQRAAAELDDLRTACRAAIRRVAQSADRLVVVGAGPSWQHFGATSRGSLAGYGVALEIPLGSDESGPVELPLSLTIGAWLLRDALGPNCGAVGYAMGPCDGVLPRFDEDDDITLVVMGDGSARRSTSAPGYFDERAAAFDALVATALATGQPDLLHINPAVGAELLAAGTDVWDAAARLLEGGDWTAELLYDADPYGVGYFVAAWTER
jgi:hypothetical protein